MNNNKNGHAVVEMDPQQALAEGLVPSSKINSFTLQAGDKITISRQPTGLGEQVTETATDENFADTNEFIAGGAELAGTNLVGTPVINSFFPTSGAPGTKVNVTGVNLLMVAQVFFNGKPATFTRLADSLLVATVPEGATDGRITVLSPFGINTSLEIFDVLTLADFTVTRFSPAQGPQGTTVFIEGRGFTGVQRVAFGNSNGIGDTAASFTVLSDTLIRATVPQVTNFSQLGFKVIKVKKGQLLVNATTLFNVTFI